MAVFNPSLIVSVTNIPAVRGFPASPPFALPTAAFQWAQQSGTGHDGNYHKGKGEVHGRAVPKLQDTYITGTGSRTGRDFTVGSGTWNDDYVNPRTGKYEILRSASSGTFEVISTSTTTLIENAEIVLRRGMNPVGSDPSDTNYFCYLYFAWGSIIDYRFGWQWGKPAHLDFTEDGWNSYLPVGTCRNIGNTDTFLATHDNELRLHLLPDYTDQTLSLIVSNTDILYHVNKNTTGLLSLPFPGNIRLVGENGWVSLGYYPYRYQQVTLKKSPVPIPPATDPTSARVVINGRGTTSPEQTTTSTLDIIPVTVGNQTVAAVGHTTTASMPDAGDNKGSETPPKIIDSTLIFPAVWVSDLGSFNPNTEIDIAAAMNMQLLEVLDDATRTRYSSALIPVNNWRSQYSGTFAHAAVSVLATNGIDNWGKAFEGIAGVGEKGWEFDRSDPLRLLMMPCADYSFAMQVPLGFEVCFDGWCIFSAVRFLAECGSCHPRFMQNIPLYIPPGATAAAPYGPAGDDCPYYILARGTGLNAKYKFLPDWTPWSILQLLVQDAGETNPITGENIPYYMGFTPDGQFHFEPYSPNFYLPVIEYSDTISGPIPGYANIEEFHLFNSVAQMRTSIDFQGIDAWSNELLYYHITMPDPVLRAIGFRFPWLERNARYASYDYITTIANSAARQSSLPTQVAYFRTPYHPNIHPGMVCLISEGATLGRVGAFYITEIRSSVGLADIQQRTGIQNCHSYVTARSIANF